MQIDFVGKLPASNTYTHNLTTCEIFKVPSVIPLRQRNPNAGILDLLQDFVQHNYVTDQIKTDRCYAFAAPVQKNLMNNSGIEVNHAKFKYVQTIAIVQRTYQRFRTSRKSWSLTMLELQLAAIVTSTSPSLPITRSFTNHWQAQQLTLFMDSSHTTQPISSTANLWKTTVTICNSELWVHQVYEKYNDITANIFEAVLMNKNYCASKAYSQPLKVGDYVFLTNFEYHTQLDKTQFMTFLQKSPCKFKKTLTHSMYIIRKTGTLKTQCVQGMRFPKFMPLVNAPELQVDEHQFYQDPDTFDEPDFFQIHSRTNTLGSEKPPDEEIDHDKEKPQEFSTQVKLATFQQRRKYSPRWRRQHFWRSHLKLLWHSTRTHL